MFSLSSVWLSLKKHPYSLMIAALGLCLFWSYWPTFVELHSRWLNDPQYSHGYLVPAFALVLLYLRRAHLKGWQFQLHMWGLPLLLLGGLLKAVAGLLYFDFLDALSLLVYLAGAMVLFGGKRFWRWSWPAIVFLVFMIPLPFRLEGALAHPLQRIATIGSTYLLQTFGFPALAEGNVIVLNDVRMGVVEACSGLSMLIVFFALAFAVAYLIQRPLWEKSLIFLSAIPIALITNIIRITATGVLHETAGSDLANLVFHDLAGYLMPPIALGLLALELKILSCIFVTPTAAKPVSVPIPGMSKSKSEKNQKTPAKQKGKKKKQKRSESVVSS